MVASHAHIVAMGAFNTGLIFVEATVKYCRHQLPVQPARQDSVMALMSLAYCSIICGSTGSALSELRLSPDNFSKMRLYFGT